MSLYRLHNVHFLELRPVQWLPGGKDKVKLLVTRAVGGGSFTRRSKDRSSGPEDGEEIPRSSIWDSNAEAVRRNRKQSQNRTNGGDPLSAWSTPRKEWNYNSGEERSEEKWQWWKSSSDDDEYDDESDEEEEEDENGFDMRSILQEQLLSSLRWGLPATLVVLPWLLGNPLFLVVSLAAIPTVRNSVGPVVNEIWQAILDFTGDSPRRRRRRSRSRSGTQSSSDEEEDAYSSWGGGVSNPQPYRYTRATSDNIRMGSSAEAQELESSVDRYSQEAQSPRPLVSKGTQQRRNVGSVVTMGGWEDLEADRRRRMPVRKAKRPSKFGRRNSRMEQPLFLRLLVALFPFLRNWGGWLSVLLLFPSLSVLENIDFALAVF